jgi:nucleoside-diphosphate-sugar epimerase
MRLLILGAAGFIGSCLVRQAEESGHDVVALCRSGRLQGFSGMVQKWELGQPIPPHLLRSVDVVVQLAHDFGGGAGAQLTTTATLELMRSAQQAGVQRQIYFSSYSASPHAASLYGQTKFAIEQAALQIDGVLVIRPGLVMGDGGIYGRIARVARAFPVLPLPDGGRGLVPIIPVERLCSETLLAAAAARIPRELNLFFPRLHSLREIVEHAAGPQRRIRVVPVPSQLVLAALRLAQALRVPLPVNADNLRGFLANQQAVHVSSLSQE